jgi:ligand-binding sensor domain-containing protein
METVRKFSTALLSISLFVLVLILMLSLPGSAQPMANVKVDNYISEDGLAPGTPVSVSIDPGGWIWVGTKSSGNSDINGFSVINENRRPVTFEKPGELNTRSINGILFCKKNNAIWFATDKGIAQWDAKTGEWKYFNASNSGLTENRVNKIIWDKNGSMLITTNGAGLFQMDKAGKIESLKSPYQTINDIYIDSKNRIWLSSNEGIAYRTDNIWVTYNTRNSSVPVNEIGAITEDSDGIIVAGTQRGVVFFDGFKWTVMDTSNSQLPVDMISGFLPDDKGDIWVSTVGGGIARVNRNRKIDRIVNRKNSNLLDNRVSSMAMDSQGNLWVTHHRGVSYVALNNPRRTDSRVNSSTYQGYIWKNAGENLNRPVTLQLGLSRNYYVPITWSWVGFYTEAEYNMLEPQVSLESGILNNQWLNVTGAFPSAQVIQATYSQGDVSQNLVLERDKPYPFPAKNPAEVQLYLKPGVLIPSDDPDIIKMAKSMVKPSSRNDMLKTAEDILFSPYFASMPFDFDAYDKTFNKEMECSNPRLWNYSTPQGVIKDKRGIGYSKNRLACALLRAVGVPARMVAGNGENYWGEVYINGLSWVPFDLTMPVYTINEKSGKRLQFPYRLNEQNMAVVSVSSSDDTTKQLVWSKDTRARLIRKDAVETKDVLEPDKVRDAKFILVYPSLHDSVPLETMIPVAPNKFMLVRKDREGYHAKVFNRTRNHVLTVPLARLDETITAELEGDFRLTFIPTLMGEHIMLRMLDWWYYGVENE